MTLPRLSHDTFNAHSCLQFKKAQELFELRAKQKNTTAENLGGRTALRNQGSKQHKLDEEALKQQEILYTQVWGVCGRGVGGTLIHSVLQVHCK